ncbi:protein-cysteine N-palmitoyltransferase Rasp isoform X1 [Apis mellifera caucasica]|nr:protein-cysteine N-palmitoyltransferase Rasp isoform X1 [Apis mellifera caucasica]KAG9430675.1 protein-cysteine N-palmitoyltransferase Rasp isoform X1 [Apis mellifera carnica]
MKMTSITDNDIKLHKYESFLYFLLWTGAVLYSIYSVFLINTYFINYNDLYGDFAPGWIWIGRKQDISDQEWRIWIPLIIKLIPWLFLHHFVSQIVKITSNFMLLCCWYIFISMLFLYFYIGILGMLCALMQPTYCLYLPTLSLGPLILYHEFINSVIETSQFLKLANFGNFIFNLIRYIFWIFFTNFFLHFLYFNAIQYHPEIIKNLNPWALYGLGYCMGQFFLIKYVVVYGLNHTLCAIDNVRAPPQPKCVARIHLYSDMWKYFDQGLYKFLIRYIYVPLLKLNFSKLIASFLCFTFIFIWHGMQTNIFIWAFLNFIGLNIESLIKSGEKNKYYSNVQKKYLSQVNFRRFNCILTSPLLAMSVISNFYFFVGEEIGNIYIYRILYDTWYSKFILLFFLYCCCQVSIDIKNWELRKYSKL